MQLLITCANILDSPVTSPASPAFIGLMYTNVFMFSLQVRQCLWLLVLGTFSEVYTYLQYFITLHPLWVYCTFINYFKRNNLTTKMSRVPLQRIQHATQNYSHHAAPKANEASRKNTENVANIKIQLEWKFVFRKTIKIPNCIIAVASPIG